MCPRALGQIGIAATNRSCKRDPLSTRKLSSRRPSTAMRPADITGLSGGSGSGRRHERIPRDWRDLRFHLFFVPVRILGAPAVQAHRSWPSEHSHKTCQPTGIKKSDFFLPCLRFTAFSCTYFSIDISLTIQVRAAAFQRFVVNLAATHLNNRTRIVHSRSALGDLGQRRR
jgi:hypothetical protein